MIDSRATAKGDKVELRSPVQTLHKDTELAVSVHMKVGSNDVSRLALYTTTSTGRAEALVYQVTQPHPDWKRHSACFPAGTYSILIVATAGKPYESDIAIDNIILGGDCNSEIRRSSGKFCARSSLLHDSVEEMMKIAYSLFYILVYCRVRNTNFYI